MKNILYGDGIHDDTLAIQELLDTQNDIVLPSPENFYLISKPLEMRSKTSLTLPRNAVIKLADNSNCFMLKNKMIPEEGSDDNFSYLSMCLDPWNYPVKTKCCENIFLSDLFSFIYRYAYM